MSTLFKQLQSLAQQSGGRLMFSIVADKSGKLTVAAMPKSDQKDASESGLLTPLVLTGTPEELDLEFVRCLSEFTEQRQSLVDQLAQTSAALNVAKGKAVDKAKGVAKPAPKADSGIVSAGDLIGAEDDDESSEESAGATTAGVQSDDAATNQSNATGGLFGGTPLVG
ncbi:PRTRC system protein E [Ralstonia insidiosa]|jgi:PRTRC genetic system protein E|uniref:PRTRC system protein E n=1 Tax=Ralstonia insidiosa TaxID=190721 RepID=A0A192A7K1_9RALS|nr:MULTISPECIES: PRTRC system protein E [Ralstonia]KMW47626.1 PRTRC system protein E [Ralstonia sp. MD27]ANJ76450.1 PRTRC system protein E [Ralstonia insidiosa]MBA9869695.1 PRTRC system protein E [Ralstonia insidiosa]MBA9884979.1 PRTRC system protein E [Ralstonia pickettii]MBA9894799.1 PRTRC system protein E [Ralstonia pickettii]